MAKRAGSKSPRSKEARKASRVTRSSSRKALAKRGSSSSAGNSGRSVSKPRDTVRASSTRRTPSPATNGEHAARPAAGSGLSARDIASFRDQLLKKRAEIVGNMSGLGSEAKNRADAAGDVSSMPIHMADVGTDNYEYELTLGLIEGERAIVKEIDEALERIAAGTYGLCLATGKPIGKARLKAKPWAKYSYEYALAQERGQYRRF